MTSSAKELGVSFALLLIVIGGVFALVQMVPTPQPVGRAEPARTPDDRSAMVVTVTSPQQEMWPVTVPAAGDVKPAEEIAVSSEFGGAAITSLPVNVGDRVTAGTELVRFSTLTAATDLERVRAQVLQAETALQEASDNARRARAIAQSGSLSEQQIAQLASSEKMANANLIAARASVRALEIRIAGAVVKSPVSGVVTKKSVIVGAAPPAGQELYRIIKNGALEWHAEVVDTQLSSIKPGMTASLDLPEKVEGKVRQVSPGITPETRRGTLYVQLPKNPQVLSGMYARGEIHLTDSPAITVPGQAIVIKDGHPFVFVLQPNKVVKQTSIQIGRTRGSQVEISQGISRNDVIVVNGAGFLTDGARVKVTAAEITRIAQP